MQVVKHPQALPANCVMCPGSVRERYIDTEMQFDWYGALYICEECVTVMGRMFGMISKGQADAIIQEHTETSTRMFHLQRRQAALEAGLRDLADAGYDNVRLDEHGDLSAHFADDESLLSDGTRALQDRAQGAAAILGSRAGTAPESGDDEELGVVRTDDQRPANKPFSI